jgi:hypothetical protein
VPQYPAALQQAEHQLERAFDRGIPLPMPRSLSPEAPAPERIF